MFEVSAGSSSVSVPALQIGNVQMSHEQHLALRAPPDDAQIWRFMSLAKFLSLLTEKSLWFCQLAQNA